MRILFVFRYGRVHRVPRLRVLRKNVHLRAKPTRVIDTPGQDADDSRRLTLFLRAGKPRAALLAITALVFPTGQAWCEVILEFPFRQSKRLLRHHDRCRKSTAGNVLAIPAMTLQHHHRLRRAFIPDRAALATAGEWKLDAQSGISGSTSFANCASDSCQPR